MPAPLTPRRLNPSDPKLLELTRETIGHGESLPTLATKLGTSHTTVYRWLEEGQAEVEEGQEPAELGSHRSFYEAVKDGEAVYEAVNLSVIRAACAPKPGGWQPAAWLLERRLPDRWGQRRDVTIHDTTTTRDVLAGIGALTLQEITRRLLASQNTPQGVSTDTPPTLPETTSTNPNRSNN